MCKVSAPRSSFKFAMPFNSFFSSAPKGKKGATLPSASHRGGTHTRTALSVARIKVTRSSTLLPSNLSPRGPAGPPALAFGKRFALAFATAAPAHKLQKKQSAPGPVRALSRQQQQDHWSPPELGAGDWPVVLFRYCKTSGVPTGDGTEGKADIGAEPIRPAAC